MSTATITTLQIAALIGLYEFAAGLASLTGRLDWNALLDEFERSRALAFVTGFVALAIGGAILAVHHHWTDPLAAIVTLVGWIALIEGWLMMVVARPLLTLSRPLVRYPRVIGGVATVFGAFMLIAALTGNAGGNTLF